MSEKPTINVGAAAQEFSDRISQILADDSPIDWDDPTTYPIDKNYDYKLDEMPIFATSAPETVDGAYSALQSLIYDEDSTPEEIALHLREQGNENFKKGKAHYKDAIKFYTDSLNVKGVKETKVHAVTLCNRAAVHLKIGNYRHAIEDCEEAIKADPSLSKAYWRAGKAYQSLYKYDDAIEFCTRGLTYLKEHPRKEEDEEEKKKQEEEEEKRKQKEKEEEEAAKKSLEQAMTSPITSSENSDEAKKVPAKKLTFEQEVKNLEKLLDECKAAKAKEEERKRRQREEAEALKRRKPWKEVTEEATEEIVKRGIKVCPPMYNLDELSTHCGNQLTVSLVGPGELSLPIIFEIEEYDMTECIASFSELIPLSEGIAEVFGEKAPWDREGVYTPENIEMYVQLTPVDDNPKTGMAKLKGTSTLSSLLAHKRYTLPLFPVIIIVSSKSKFRHTFFKNHKLI